jgi:hypothetical protein
MVSQIIVNQGLEARRGSAVEKLEVERDYMEKQTVAGAHSKALTTLKDELPEEFDKKILCPP